MQSYEVYLDNLHIDTVFFSGDNTPEEIAASLIEYDGYPPGINVKEE